MLTQDPKITLLEMYRDNWDPGNTGGITPRVHTGWFNNEWKQPQVTVVAPNETVLNGGETGFSALQSGDGIPMKRLVVDIQVLSWAHREMLHDGSLLAINPKLLVFLMKEEIRRITRENTLTPGGGLEWVSVMNGTEEVDHKARPVIFRYDLSVRCKYDER